MPGNPHLLFEVLIASTCCLGAVNPRQANLCAPVLTFCEMGVNQHLLRMESYCPQLCQL
jgi:hypothetical protein